ncbi:protein GLUTAMINE DUMPER 5-like [Neltuma alba]|uniref:protein GLUTAMINE DUMPER 5-like n=1 Tax=Neltuma alba TaxID=207710 RepID=UPI0010A48AF9|nr:protein GLUTAMINE DUMPER 5-like [Prosopis alba]XP_028807100.1 protein GLUTAMINE DUMPER 5-like [Prosopis alba]XP_028807200.1 protein GLUTAMINE DUMPER 5-like [Prosopis alba]XP_028807208.1 protein GLUTAMINE DUMPER 5-like [Prosopis alba]
MRTVPNSFSPSSSLAPGASSLSSVQRSPWHSPVPYLFGGLAAMLGLIAFALLILACSYWKLSGFLQSEEGSERDLESGDVQKQSDSANNETVTVFEEKILVIMAGDENPTFLATPVCSKASSLGDGICKVGVDAQERSEKQEKETECENQQGNQDEQRQNQQ